MIEKIVLDFLTSRLVVPVRMEVPTDPPKRFVVLKKADSSREDSIDTSMVIAQSYAETLLEAAELNELVKATMDDLTDLDEICSSRLNSDYNFTDTASKRYRYQAVFDITHY